MTIEIITRKHIAKFKNGDIEFADKGEELSREIARYDEALTESENISNIAQNIAKDNEKYKQIQKGTPGNFTIIWKYIFLKST